MKKTLAAMIILSLSISCSSSKQTPKELAPADGQITIGSLVATEAEKGTWRITQDGSVNMYLLVGEKSALMIDTGYGSDDLPALIKKITDKPALLVNTHGHSDHVGGNRHFENVFTHKADLFTVKGYSFNAKQITTVSEGYLFDLGGRTVEVIETPGHTAGSIVLLDKERKMLFTGDNNNSHVWLFLNESLPLSVYVQSIKKLVSRRNEFTVMHVGHGQPYDPSFLDDILSCTELIYAGKTEGQPYNNYSNAFAYDYAGAKVIVNPKKLK
jgi:glyoxylase-like metal-dependent hydrolase (beta-lactamase superfamily II)